MIEKHHSQLSVRKQCKLLGVNRNRLDRRRPRKVEGDEAINEVAPLFGAKGEMKD